MERKIEEIKASLYSQNCFFRLRYLELSGLKEPSNWIAAKTWFKVAQWQELPQHLPLQLLEDLLCFPQHLQPVFFLPQHLPASLLAACVFPAQQEEVCCCTFPSAWLLQAKHMYGIMRNNAVHKNADMTFCRLKRVNFVPNYAFFQNYNICGHPLCQKGSQKRPVSTTPAIFGAEV